MPATTSATFGAPTDLDSLSRYDGLHAVRLNPLGAYALGLTDTYKPAEPERGGRR